MRSVLPARHSAAREGKQTWGLQQRGAKGKTLSQIHAQWERAERGTYLVITGECLDNEMAGCTLQTKQDSVR